MDNTKLIRIQKQNPSLYERIREVTSRPAIYLAPTIKAIVDERDIVPKTRRKIFNPGLSLNGGIIIYVPTAYFRWREPFRTFEEVSTFIEEGEKEYGRRITQIEEGGDSFESRLLLKQVDREMAIPGLEVGRLYDGITELPICPTKFFGKNLSNGQRLYHIFIGYKPFSGFDREIMLTSLLSYQDHLDMPTRDKATKPSLADLVRGMLPQLEPTG